MDSLARTVDEMMARAKRSYILMIKVNSCCFPFFFEEFLKRSREHVLGVPIELYKHYRKFQRV